MIASVIKVEVAGITLQADEDSKIVVLPTCIFPNIEGGVQMGQIFEINEQENTVTYCEEETNFRRQKVAELLAKRNKV